MAELLLILLYKPEDQHIAIGFQNDTEDQFELDGEITFNGVDPIKIKGTLSSRSKSVLGEIPFDRINDYPHFEMELERHTRQGHAETIECKIKPKPKHFIKLSLLSGWDNRSGRSYEVWTEKQQTGALRNISIPRFAPGSITSSKRSGVIKDLSELAVFNRELDLHANKIFDDPGKVTAEEIYIRQMKTFQWYMDKAKSMNIDRVFIIHGVGSGRLKTDIAHRLEYDQAVVSFTNEHHPKYGFGATEVVFK